MSHNTYIHRGVRRLIRPLAATPVTPNQLTTLRLLTGLGAAAMIAVGEAGWQYAGAALFVLSFILDRADGELARMTGKMSPGGHAYDLASDFICNAVLFVGIGIGARGGMFGHAAIAMGIVAGLSIAVVFWAVLRMEQVAGERAGELNPIGGFDPDDPLLFVPLTIWLGLADYILAAAAIGASLFAVAFLWRFREPLLRRSRS